MANKRIETVKKRKRETKETNVAGSVGRWSRNISSTHAMVHYGALVTAVFLPQLPSY